MKKIPIRNIYYLLCYAWNMLEESQVVNISQLDCETYADLFARVLNTGVAHVLRRGLDRDYIVQEEEIPGIRGKLDFNTTIKRNLLLRGRTYCHFDSLEYDVTHNQIVKTTIGKLVRCDDLDRGIRADLLGLYRRLHDISEIDCTAKAFASVRLHRNNAFYGFLLQVCRIVLDNLLIDEEKGTSQFRDFVQEETMHRLFESFVRNFYNREQSTFTVKVDQIGWQRVSCSEDALRLLPSMKTDISLDSPERKIVIDTKYYGETLQVHHEKESIRSGHLL